MFLVPIQYELCSKSHKDWVGQLLLRRILSWNFQYLILYLSRKATNLFENIMMSEPDLC